MLLFWREIRAQTRFELCNWHASMVLHWHTNNHISQLALESHAKPNIEFPSTKMAVERHFVG